MSNHKHNYSQYSNKNNHKQPNVANVVEAMGHPDPVGEPGPMGVDGFDLVKETVETKFLPEMIEGVVSGCAKLNVRSDASLFADVVCTLDVMSEIMIDVNKSTKDWLYVCTATGMEGYCMKKFVDARL